MESTSNTEKKAFKCDLCEKLFKQRCGLTMHLRDIHEKRKDFECAICFLRFSRKSTLDSHVKNIHERRKDFDCPSCEASFAEKSNLSKHVATVHQKLKIFKCHECNLPFGEKCTLDRHITNIHKKTKGFQCPKCDHKTSQRGNLTIHIKTCTGKSNMSSMELKMKQALDDLKIEHMHDSTHDNLKGTGGYLRFDFIVPALDESFIMIEMNGRQHYEPVNFGGMDDDCALEKFERQLAHDGLKRIYCQNNQYPLLEVRFDDPHDYRDILREFIEESDVQV